MAGCGKVEKKNADFADIFQLSLPCSECEFISVTKREEAEKKETIKAEIKFLNGSYRIKTRQEPDGFEYDMIIDGAYLYVMNHVSKTIIAYDVNAEVTGGITKKIFVNAGMGGAVKPKKKKTIMIDGIYEESTIKALRKGTDFYLNSVVKRYNRLSDGLMTRAECHSPLHEINAGNFIKREGPVKEIFRIKKFKCRKQSPALFSLPAGYRIIMPPAANSGDRPAVKKFGIGL